MKFSGADLTGAQFTEDNMGGYVDLSGADFSGAKLDNATFEGAVYSEQTRFPEGFAIELSGLRKGTRKEAQ